MLSSLKHYFKCLGCKWWNTRKTKAKNTPSKWKRSKFLLSLWSDLLVIFASSLHPCFFDDELLTTSWGDDFNQKGGFKRNGKPSADVHVSRNWRPPLEHLAQIPSVSHPFGGRKPLKNLLVAPRKTKHRTQKTVKSTPYHHHHHHHHHHHRRQPDTVYHSLRVLATWTPSCRFPLIASHWPIGENPSLPSGHFFYFKLNPTKTAGNDIEKRKNLPKILQVLAAMFKVFKGHLYVLLYFPWSVFFHLDRLHCKPLLDFFWVASTQTLNPTNAFKRMTGNI